jgi:hypothetical protein
MSCGGKGRNESLLNEMGVVYPCDIRSFVPKFITGTGVKRNPVFRTLSHALGRAERTVRARVSECGAQYAEPSGWKNQSSAQS